MNELGKFLHDRRVKLGLTLEEVGNAVGVSKSTVLKWESGNISNMRRDRIALLADVLKVPPRYPLHSENSLNEPFLA